MQSLQTFLGAGSSFNRALVVGAVEALVMLIAVACCSLLATRAARWRAARAQQRYARQGIRDLERYLGVTARHPQG